MSQSMKYVLVTGTNSGLGLGICTRLLDDFLQTCPPDQSLTLIFTTRSARKGAETLQVLRSHLSRTTSDPDSIDRVHLRPENVELTDLLSVRALSRRLLASNIPRLNAVILNAGIGGWSGINYFQAIPHMVVDIVSSTTWPEFKLGVAGLITRPQFPEESGVKSNNDGGGGGGGGGRGEEPPLGQIFCANVFGHYMLVRGLMPLLCACEANNAGRIVWVSSIEPRARHFNEDDLMALKTKVGYESSKRLTDLLALTFDNDVAARSVADFTAVDDDNDDEDAAIKRRKKTSTPTMHIGHPGICVSSIVSLHWILAQSWVLTIYAVRLLGAVWTTASTYTAGIVFTWLALAPAEEIRAREAEYGNGGRVKWGSAADRFGKASIRPTEVEGWGLSGDGKPYLDAWWAGSRGRAPGAVEVKREDVPEFVAQGGRVWRDMEALRKEWEERIEEFDRARARASEK